MGHSKQPPEEILLRVEDQRTSSWHRKRRIQRFTTRLLLLVVDGVIVIVEVLVILPIAILLCSPFRVLIVPGVIIILVVDLVTLFLEVPRLFIDVVATSFSTLTSIVVSRSLSIDSLLILTKEQVESFDHLLLFQLRSLQHHHLTLIFGQTWPS